MRMWMNGFLDVFAEAGHPISDDNIILCDTSSASAVTVCEELYRTGRMPQALFCESDVLAHGVLFACHKLGIAIPQDLKYLLSGLRCPK